MADGFWDSAEGRAMLWYRRWLRVRRLRLDGEPEQKGRRGGGHRTACAQRDLIEQLSAFGHGPLTGPVALDVSFHTGRAQPPAPHRLAKHLLDVLGAVRTGAGPPGRRHVLYRDDRQVKLLHVVLWVQGPEGSGPSAPHTAITARPLRDVVADLTLARATAEGDYRAHDEDFPLTMPPLPDLDPEPTFDPRYAATPHQAEQWRKLNATLAAFDHGQLQQALLSRTDALLTRMLSGEPAWIGGARPPKRPYADHPDLHLVYAELNRVIADSREMLLSQSVTLPLPELPRSGGQGRNFTTEVHQAVENITAHRPVFTPLRVPLKVTLLVIPPEQGKDLDNLALAVLPTVHRVLQPPAITSYEVIELVRTPGDPPEGHLRLALGNGFRPRSTWERVTDYLEQQMERR
ncbi:hypothetical protein [Actinosynnema sp. NPDC023587]|uniref:hypothetical protein n=1 Tax=Actinosynnema sp. NPDC023587 TaxID=3154695 RepID=UPI0033F25925